MGEIAPPAILHSTDINRSSQDTQQLRASQTEPVRHGAGGGSTTRHNSFFYERRSQRAAVPKKKNPKRKKKLDCQPSRKWEESHMKLTVSPRAPLRFLVLIGWRKRKFRTVPTADPSPLCLSRTETVPCRAGTVRQPRSTALTVRTPARGPLPSPSPPPPPPPGPQATPGRMPRTPGRWAEDTHPARWEVDAERRFTGGEALLSLPALPRSGRPFSVSETPIAEPSRAVQYPRGLRNTEPLIARRSRGGRQAWRARHSIAWSFRAQPQFGETYPTACAVCALAQQQQQPAQRNSPSLSHSLSLSLSLTHTLSLSLHMSDGIGKSRPCVCVLI